jgi:hypothetical protein
MLRRYVKVNLSSGEVVEEMGILSTVTVAATNQGLRPNGLLVVPVTSIVNGRFFPKPTEQQEKQLNHLRRLQSGEELHNLHTYEAYCNDCNDGIHCHTAGTVIDFINKRHLGHRTGYQNFGVSNPLRSY